MPYSVVCISRSVGAEGDQVGRLVAERLGFRYLDEEIVARAAERAGVSPEDVADAERRRSLARRLLEGMGQGGAAESYSFGGFIATGGAYDDLRGVIREVIEESAAEGNVVIVAHAASYALGERPGVLRVLVTASAETRVGRLTESGLEPKEATRAVKDSDAGRADYLRRFHQVDAEQPEHYDLVVSTDRLDVEQAAGLVVAATSG